jgi:hypothetical protein
MTWFWAVCILAMQRPGVSLILLSNKALFIKKSKCYAYWPLVRLQDTLLYRRRSLSFVALWKSVHAEEAHEPSLRGLHYEWFLFVLPIPKNFNSKWTVTWSYVKKFTKKFTILLMGKYHMIPHVIWYHATTPQILNLQPLKNSKNFFLAFTTCVYIPYDLQNKIWHIHREIKKTNLTWILSQKDKSTNETIHMSICLFFSMYI